MKYSAIVALSFGRNAKLSHFDKLNGRRPDQPGRRKVNNYLADVVDKIYKEHPVLCILQEEVGMGSKTHPWYEKYKIISKHRQKGKYLDTEEVLRQTLGFLTNKRIFDDSNLGIRPFSIILVAHPLHFYRAKYIAEKLGFEVSEGRVDKCKYDRNDSQIWTRNCLLFGIWNCIAWCKALLIK